ncbi:extracellular solute-binding protein [Anaerobacillus alkaliphilus]|uniref:Extracellular solute-binding protein n=1 Tax=Anaerobacillus alkaliphilus TaxID=1548597 RepID=A0A4Q0VWG9_9BACI|nr:extracellular solute-binding protein [Anaerobacillus alkaliphilus]RXJ02545.1 extracellular solute-binding protein [Anaerobacillus alkaliphilus]
MISKKFLFLSLILVFTVLISVACSSGNSSTEPKEPTDPPTETGEAWKEWKGEITIWDGPRWRDAAENQYHWLEAKAAEFEDLYPGVKVKIVQTPWAEMGDSLSVAIAGRAWPDIAPVDISGSAVSINHIESGVIEAIDPFFTAEELADFYPNALAEYEYNGKHYGVPNSMSVHVMLLNLDIFEEKGVEPPANGKWTYDEFVKKMEALTGDGVYGFSTYILDGYYEAWPFLLMDGGYPLNEDLTEYAFDSPEAISGLQKLVDLKTKYNVAPFEMGGPDVGQTWQEWGNAERRSLAVTPWATWAIAAAQGDNFKTNFMVAEYPSGKLGESVSIGGVGGWVMFAQQDDNKKRMTAEFVKHISSTDEQFVMSQNYGTFPARISTADLDPFADNPEMARAQEITEQAVMLPRHPEWARIDEAIQRELQLALNGEKTAEQALSDARRVVESILK